jgi:pimeloyl-ACP methyl ester carboxylesterase
VSWYEAAAFAEYAGKSLPTVPHWLRATGLPNLRDDIAAGNFASQAARPVTALKDLGAILLSAGLVASVRRNLPPEIDPVNFAPRLRLPVLMLSGRYDFLLPVDTAQKPLFDALGTPAADKRHFIFDEGHVPARTVLIRETLDWLDRRLGPVTMR